MLKQIIVHSLPKTHQRNPTTSYYIFNWIHKSIPNRTPYSSNMFSLKTVMYHWAIYKLNFSSHNSTILKTVELVKHKTSRAKKHKVCPTNIWIFLMYPITNRSVQLLKDRHTVQMRGDQQSFSVGVDEVKRQAEQNCTQLFRLSIIWRYQCSLKIQPTILSNYKQAQLEKSTPYRTSLMRQQDTVNA